MGAQELGWGAGYPNCQTDKLVTIDMGDGIFMPVRREIAVLVGWLCHETERRSYPLIKGWCWTFACRSIRGYPNVPSNHSWGLAVDVNAPKNPMLYGQPGWQALHDSGRTDMPAWVPPLWKAHMFGWGGDYSSRQDAMHFEFMGTPADAARITAGLHGTPTDPSPLTLKRTLHPGMRGLDVSYVQQTLNNVYDRWHFLDCRAGNLDGDYGTLTAGAVLHFKENLYDFETKVAHANYAHLTFHQPVDNTCGAVALGALLAWLHAK